MADNFLERLEKELLSFEAMKNAKTAVCALSGGADSVCLLLCVSEISKQAGFKTAACHLNHGLRGEESDGDERFCESLCERLGVELYHEKINVSEYGENHESSEETARRVRYDFFARALSRFGENSVLLTAHNADDNAETVLLNLIRGTGLRGLCGIPPERDRIIRPLLKFTRAEIEGSLAEKGQDFVTDKTNFSDKYTRNKVRNKLIPEILKINPSFSRTMKNMTAILRADSDFLEDLAREELEKCKSGRGYEAAKIDALPAPIKSRAVKKILSLGQIEPSKLRVEKASLLLKQRSARYNPCKNKFFTIRKGICFTEEIEQRFGGFNEKKG